MKLAIASGRLGLVALAAIAVPCALAQDAHWYGGINLGQSRATIDDVRILGGLRAGGFSSATIVDDDRDNGYKFFFGRQFNRNFAIEGGVFDLGKFAFTATTVPAGTLDGNIRVRGVNLDLVGTVPITERFSAFGRVGVNHAESRDSFSGAGLVRVINPNPSKRDTNYKYGLGLSYALTDNFGVRAEAERFRINDAVGNKGDIDLISVGLVYRFGRKVAAMAPAPRAAYEPVAPAPRTVVPEPVTAAPPAQPPVVLPPPPRRVTFSADALFDFDKATVKPEGKQALDKFAADLRGSRFDVIIVTGNTDRIGSDAYNLALSARRAESVQSYLAGPLAIPAGRISAKGAGESNPVTKPGDCKGTKATKALIACLQPDRRVDVEVTGTK